ncbi:MAG: lipase [Lachnospiraceae bacterium]|nr:lipase [Candidatus Colinaster scatohippi]
MSNYTKWVAAWGNAMSITDHRPETYAKNLTLRYPIYCPFDGDAMRITLDNYCGLEDVTITEVSILLNGVFYDVTFENGAAGVTIPAGGTTASDEIDIEVKRGDKPEVSIYLGEYTQMRSSVVALGPLSSGKYAVGNMTHMSDIPIDISRKTDVFYFLSNVSVHTEECNRAIVCYGDSITAQDWPDYLSLLLAEKGIRNVSVIRRATSGSRILREYNNITYESYGLMGKKRFEHEVPTDGADTVIIQQGINDIIHPVGVEVNPFRPMSDLPTVDEMKKGYEWYLDCAKKMGYRTYVGTLLPIDGWRTYADFRENMKNEFNDWLRGLGEEYGVNGVIDFDKAVRDERAVTCFGNGYDSGDHLHPSHEGYKRMAEEALKIFT